jgi:lipopolysaccharide export LptBFGC system permease protein LptF
VILQRYILRELVGSFIFAFLTVLGVCLVGTMFQVFRAFPGLGIEALTKALPMATGAMAWWVLMVASCIASTLVYARLAADNEITAMRACGIHTWRIVSPAVLLGLMLVGMAYPLNEIVVPWTRWSRRLLFRDATPQILKTPQPGKQDFRIGSMRITYTDFVDGRMQNPTVSKYDKSLILVQEWFAPSGAILADKEPIRVVLTKPRVWRIAKNGQEEWLSAENDLSVDIPTEDLDKIPRQPADQPADVLWESVVATKDRQLRVRCLTILHTRYAQSLAPMLMILVAMPIGILVRKGSRLAGLGAALPPMLVYFVSFFILQGLGDKGRVPPLVAAYAPNILLGGVASLLLWGVSRR